MSRRLLNILDKHSSSMLDYTWRKGVAIKMECKIRELRKERGWSQAELAERANVSRVTVSMLENGSLQVTKMDTLIKLADALDSKVGDIFLE